VATVGLPFTNVEPLTGVVNITVPSDGANIISIGGVINPGDTINFVPDATATPSDITLESTTFDSPTTGNPMTLNFQGVDITATVSPSLLSFIQVPDAGDGTGLPSGTTPGDGSIIMQALDPFFTPANEPNVIDAFDAFDVVTTPTFEVPSKVTSNRLIQRNSESLPTVDPTTGALFFNRSNFECLDIETAITSCAWVFAVFETYDCPTTATVFLSVGDAGSTFNGVIRDDSPVNRRGVDGADGLYWNGQIDGSNNPVLNTGESQYFNNDGATSAGGESNWWFLIEGAEAWKILFASSSDGTNIARPGGGKLHYISFHSQVPSDADIQRMQGFAAWLLADRISGAAATDRLPVGHPYRTARPLLGAGSTSGITIAVPVVSYDRTVSGAPTGSAIAIFPRSSSLIADLDQFTLDTGNDSGDGALVVNETIPNDTPASGFIRVARDDGSEDRLAYASWSGSTFTLSGTLPATYSSGNGAYVGYLDVLGSSTGTETVNLEYVSNRSCVLCVRLGSGSSRSKEIREDITLGASDFERQVSTVFDAINTSS
jgi:hypothetical protein